MNQENQHFPAAPSKPMKKTVRRAVLGTTAVVVAGAGIAASYAGAAFAADTPTDPSTATSTATSASASPTPGAPSANDDTTQAGQTAPGQGPRGEHGFGHDGPRGEHGGIGAVVKETAVVKASNGTISTELRVNGEVTAVSATSITIKGADASTTTYTIPATVKLADTVKVGAKVSANGTVNAGTNTLKHAHVQGEKPSAKDMPAPPAQGTAATARPTILHTTSVVADPANQGKFITRVSQSGTVTAVSATSISIKSEDNVTTTFALSAKVTTTAKVGDKALAFGKQSGTTTTAERVATGDELTQGPRGERGGIAPGTETAPGAPSGSAAPTSSTSGASTESTSSIQNGANIPLVSSLV